MRELLKDARDWICDAKVSHLGMRIQRDVLLRLIDAYLAVPESNAMEMVKKMCTKCGIQKMHDTGDGFLECDECGHIEEKEKQKPIPNSTEFVRKIREKVGSGLDSRHLLYNYRLSEPKAAALIEDYGKRVPRAMLDKIELLYEICKQKGNGGVIFIAGLVSLFAKHGYRAE